MKNGAASYVGKKLTEIADVALNIHSPSGGCVTKIDDLNRRTEPTSIVTGALIVNMQRCATVEELNARGHQPVMLPSQQFADTPSAAAAASNWNVATKPTEEASPAFSHELRPRH